MLAANLPIKIQIPFANSAGAGYSRLIPVPSQAGIQPGAASWTDGFPSTTFTPLGSGGVRPFGQDFNGILKYITQVLQAMQAGNFPLYDATFSAQVGGYFNGAIVRSADGHAFWRSTVDNNTTNPDAGGANWVAHGVHTVFGRTGPDIVAQSGDYSAAQVGAVALTDFQQVFGPNGYQISPNGRIDQWCEQYLGDTISPGHDSLTFTYPIPFPHFSGIPRISIYDPSHTAAVWGIVTGHSLTGCTVWIPENNSGVQQTTVCIDVRGN